MPGALYLFPGSRGSVFVYARSGRSLGLGSVVPCVLLACGCVDPMARAGSADHRKGVVELTALTWPCCVVSLP